MGMFKLILGDFKVWLGELFGYFVLAESNTCLRLWIEAKIGVKSQVLSVGNDALRLHEMHDVISHFPLWAPELQNEIIDYHFA